jgi:hypothetical protein
VKQQSNRSFSKYVFFRHISCNPCHFCFPIIVFFVLGLNYNQAIQGGDVPGFRPVVLGPLAIRKLLVLVGGVCKQIANTSPLQPATNSDFISHSVATEFDNFVMIIILILFHNLQLCYFKKKSKLRCTME